MLRQDDWQKAQLVTAAWLWGKQFGGHLGSCMIMSVLMNRVKAGWGTVAEVVDKIPKYAAITEMPIGVPSVWSPEFVRLLHEVESVHAGSQDYSRGGLYWLDSAQAVTNPWFKEKILGNLDIHPKVADMNSLMVLR